MKIWYDNAIRLGGIKYCIISNMLYLKKSSTTGIINTCRQFYSPTKTKFKKYLLTMSVSVAADIYIRPHSSSSWIILPMRFPPIELQEVSKIRSVFLISSKILFMVFHFVSCSFWYCFLFFLLRFHFSYSFIATLHYFSYLCSISLSIDLILTSFLNLITP